uniref:Uncharacterized protein n=1 Tax=Odontella aurita TaxID=265563 RepID=A0A7S4K3Z9_9STRA|mmetsp:Transcript_61146/g.180860  ORF Transcript_61146/g.180860 Transcript_61146/m.180860 type:complete len:100 (+) Transcript_61146:593-892(+)
MGSLYTEETPANGCVVGVMPIREPRENGMTGITGTTDCCTGGALKPNMPGGRVASVFIAIPCASGFVIKFKQAIQTSDGRWLNDQEKTKKQNTSSTKSN